MLSKKKNVHFPLFLRSCCAHLQYNIGAIERKAQNYCLNTSKTSDACRNILYSTSSLVIEWSLYLLDCKWDRCLMFQLIEIEYGSSIWITHYHWLWNDCWWYCHRPFLLESSSHSQLRPAGGALRTATIDWIQKCGGCPAFVVVSCARTKCNENKKQTIRKYVQQRGHCHWWMALEFVWWTYPLLWCTTIRHNPFWAAPRCRLLSSTPPNGPWRSSQLGKWVDCPTRFVLFDFVYKFWFLVRFFVLFFFLGIYSCCLHWEREEYKYSDWDVE